MSVDAVALSDCLSQLTIYDFANMTWSQAVADPNFQQQFEAYTGEAPIPKWICDLYAHQTQKKLATRTPKPRIRAANCTNWIKTTNHILPFNGIRTRNPERVGTHKNAMSRPLSQVHYERHMLHLMSSLLSIRTNSSPFTLVLDDLNQRAAPFLSEIMRRGLSRNINVVLVSFEGSRFHPGGRHIPAFGLNAAGVLQSIEQAMTDRKESLVIIDSMLEAVATKNIDMKLLFNLVVMKYASTLVGVYHTDILPAPSADAYAPPTLDLLKFMATTVVTCKSFAHALAAKAARERALPEPTFGLLQGAEGVVQCINANDRRGIILDTEFRRKSGRPERESFFLRPALVADYHTPQPGLTVGVLKREFVILLDQQPAYKNKEVMGLVNAASVDDDMSFNLGLTDKQKVAREAVVLPYFDAQKGEGGEGGRILYDMGEEDDFDEEEDEI
ncbi:hypothetical protein N0V90_012290 [Kalmusia sp. IMI 367209]|nr:hypothetical protein N0V90_012290 [Kalmusia sp. IMI 367209]